MNVTPAITESRKKPEAVSENGVKPQSKGARLFNWLVYGGIAGVVVFLANLPFTFWAKYGSGAKWWKSSAEQLTKSGFSEYAAEQILNTTVLGAVGNAAVVPIKLLEDYKPRIVAKFNKLLGEKDVGECVQEESKQTWWSLLKSRVVAYGVVWASLQGAVWAFGGKSFRKFEEKFSEYIVCKPLGRPTHISANETKTFQYGKIAALDVFATTAATILLYIGSRIFVRKSKQQQSNNPKEKADSKASSVTTECLPCRLKSFAASESPAASYAKTIADEKARSPEASLAQ